MPFKSEAQRKYLYSQKPSVAKKYSAHAPKKVKLPRRVKKGK